MRKEDVDLLHSLWREATVDPKFRELHHYHVLNVALQEMERRMHNGLDRDEVMKDLQDEMCRPCGPTLPDEGSAVELSFALSGVRRRMAQTPRSC